MKKLIIFDLDGTVADTSEGLLDTHRHTIREMGLQEPDEADMKPLLSAGLFRTYNVIMGLSEEETRRAITIYRNHYGETGLAMSRVYDGIEKLLADCRKKGLRLAVATMKNQVLARKLTEILGIDSLFDAVCGMDAGDSMTKADIIGMCCTLAGISKEEAVMVGDSTVDSEGAKAAGVDFIGVTYGFGFRPDEKLPFTAADSISQLRRILCI